MLLPPPPLLLPPLLLSLQLLLLVAPVAKKASGQHFADVGFRDVVGYIVFVVQHEIA